MRYIIIFFNICVLGFLSNDFVIESYEVLNNLTTKPNYIFNDKFLRYIIFICPLLALPILNILIILDVIKIRIIHFVTIFMNVIIFTFFSLVLFVGISDEFNEEMLLKTKMFFSAENHEILLTFLIGIILPFVCIYLIYNKK